MQNDATPAILARLDRWRVTHRRRGFLYRVAWVLVGFAVLFTGIAMIVLPGPAVVVIPTGLAMLSLEFVWAERLLHVSIRRGLQAKSMIPARRMLLLGAAVATAVVATAAVALFVVVL